MGGTINHTTPDNLDQWMRNIERRMLTQERRSPEFSVTQKLGAGMGKYAKQVFDWNTEYTWQAGQYWSDTGSFNSPDPLKEWIGFTRSASEVGGIQELFSFNSMVDVIAKRQRTFVFNPDGIPQFGGWNDPTVNNFGGNTFFVAGPWGTSVPGPITGTPITLPSGVLRAQVNMSAYTSTGASIIIEVYMDGNHVADCIENAAIGVNQHMQVRPGVWTISINAGIHYIDVRQTSGTSDGLDYLTFYGIVLPA